MEKKADKKQIASGKTVFQEFADFLAQDKGDRDAMYELTVSENTFVLFRRRELDAS